MNEKLDRCWQIWVDTGGTFTDCLALDPNHILHRVKVLSSSALRGTIREVITPKRFRIDIKWSVPDDFIQGFRFRLLDVQHPEVNVEKFFTDSALIELNRPFQEDLSIHSAFEVHTSEEAPLLAARLVTGTPMESSFPEMIMRLATTRGTNALLERHGAPTALFITKGFGDLLRIGDQQRADLFALDVHRPEPLYEAVIEVEERISADGSILKSLQLNELKKEAIRLIKANIRTAAITLMHSYINPVHEKKIAECLYELGFHHVSCSSSLAPFIKIVPRAQTAVVDGYLSLIIDDYLQNIQRPLRNGRFFIMTSTGGIVQPQSYHAKDSLLSGPAGGVVGAVLAGRRSGFTKIIAFDMGGTSTDVARFDGDYDYVFEHQVGDAHLVAPALAIESVAAGGGSICSFDGTELHVGPESGGAQPGPACYGAGGPLTLTDVNLLLGRLDPSRFEIPIDADSADRVFEKMIIAIEASKNEKTNREKLLEGFLDIASERMADAIRRISIRKGYDPEDYALVAFGGAGAQHACDLAELLSINTILIPEDASLLSALGLGHAVIERFAERQILQELNLVEAHISQWIQELVDQTTSTLKDEGVEEQNVEVRRRIVNLRFVGQDSVLQIEFVEDKPLDEAFRSQYEIVFGHWPEGRSIEVESIRVVVSSRRAEVTQSQGALHRFSAPPDRHKKAYFNGQWRSVPVFERDTLYPGAEISGPSLIVESHSMTVVESGWRVVVDYANGLVLNRISQRAEKTESIHPEVVRLELFTNRFGTIAQEMGEMLRRTAISTNVKERLDFSCGLLDRHGELVVNAPHIPVHLGSMGLCVRELREVLPMEPDDVIITNHPRFGGSHLPDVTVVTPVYLPGGQLLGYVANRAHHAEIGGVRPGSMPPAASSLAEEGVVIPPMYLMKNGESHWDDLVRLLDHDSPYPSRGVEENLADLRAAVAANRNGVSALLALAQKHGEETVWHYMDVLKNHAEAKIRGALRRIPDGSYTARESLDDGSPLCVRIDIKGDEAIIDFSGSADVHPKNLNGTPAIVSSVVIYILRLLVNEPLPLNEGLMRAITLHIPPGILNPPFPDDPFQAPAVVGGNVETSQRLVDTLLKALKLVACSQGTMNNTLFGTDHYSYYETVCGGCGGGPDFDGTDAVHSHMTNTRITDPEILEHRYPVRLERFSIRQGSGGQGKHRGGNGVIREISFLEQMSLSVLGQHRQEGPYGLEGGEPGKTAKQTIFRQSGEVIRLDSIDGCTVYLGDRMILETPGGGGYGLKDHHGATRNDTEKKRAGRKK